MKINRLFSVNIFLLVLLFQTITAKAENIIINTDEDILYVYDDFRIKGNTLTDKWFSGKGWATKWTYLTDGMPLKVNEGSSLVYPSGNSLLGSGGYIEKEGKGLSIIERSLTDSYDLFGSTFYLSFLVQKDADGAFSLEGYGEDNMRYGVRVAETGAVEVRASASWGEPSVEGVFANGETYLLVLAKQGNANKIALFKEGDVIPSDPANIEWAVTNSGKTGVDLDRFQFVFSSGNVKIDELRLGATLKSVTQGSTWLNTLDAPSNLTLTPSTVDFTLTEQTTTLNWTDNTDNETGFKVLMDGAEIATLNADVTSYEVTALFKDPKYHFNVVAYTDEGVSTQSNTAILNVDNPSGIYLELPAIGSTLYQTIPHFSWKHQSPSPLEGVYEIMIADNSDFSSPVDMDTIPSFINYYSPNFEMDYDLEYYWKVRFVDENGLSEGGWSMTYSFTISAPEVVVDVLPSDGWNEIKTKWQTVLSTSETTDGAVELRFPENAILNVKQPSNSDEADRSNGFLLYADGYDDVLVNGRGAKIIIEATHGEWLCGFMEINNSRGMQVKDIIIDYHPNSLYQIGGVIQNFDKEERTFEVVIDTDVYQTYEVLKHYTDGYFLSKEHQQKVGLKGVAYQMEESWEQARINETTFKFTCGLSEYGRYRDEVENGDYFVLSHRAGDIIYLPLGIDNFVVNNITTHACRGRFFGIGAGCKNIRSLNNQYLRTQNRIMGSSSGGVGADRGDNIWYEGNRYEYSRDDMFHNGSNAGKGSVFRRNELIGAYRNSIWVQADRTWVAENKIEYAGSSGIHIGYAPSNPGTMPDVVLVEGNTIIRPNWNGIKIDTDTSNPDFETGSIYSENLIIRDNHIIDNYRNEAIFIEYAKNVVLENNTISNTIDNWSVFSEGELQKGIYISNSENVTGSGNQISDTRVQTTDIILVDDNCKDVDVDITFEEPIDKEPTAILEDWANTQTLKVYPNPSLDGIYHLNKRADYTVFNIQGKVIGRFTDTKRIDLSEVNAGLYILKEDKSGQRFKILK